MYNISKGLAVSDIWQIYDFHFTLDANGNILNLIKVVPLIEQEHNLKLMLIHVYAHVSDTLGIETHM